MTIIGIVDPINVQILTSAERRLDENRTYIKTFKSGFFDGAELTFYFTITDTVSKNKQFYCDGKYRYAGSKYHFRLLVGDNGLYEFQQLEIARDSWAQSSMTFVRAPSPDDVRQKVIEMLSHTTLYI